MALLHRKDIQYVTTLTGYTGGFDGEIVGVIVEAPSCCRFP